MLKLSPVILALAWMPNVWRAAFIPGKGEIVWNHWVLGIRVKSRVRTSIDQEDSNIRDKYRVFHSWYLDCPSPWVHQRGISVAKPAPWTYSRPHWTLPGYFCPFPSSPEFTDSSPPSFIGFDVKSNHLRWTSQPRFLPLQPILTAPTTPGIDRWPIASSVCCSVLTSA